MAPENGGVDKTAQALAGINTILTQVTTLLGVGFTTANMLIALFKRQGIPVEEFQAEIVKYEGQRQNVADAIAEFRRLFPETAAPPPRDPSGDDSGLPPAPSDDTPTTIGG